MAKLALKVGKKAAEVEEVEGKGYSGPVPPRGIYPFIVRKATIEPSKDGKRTMLVVISDLSAPKDDERSQYNGYSIWEYFIIPESEDDEYYEFFVGKINRFLAALAPKDKDQLVKNAFWGDQADISNDDPPQLTKIGPVSLVSRQQPIRVHVQIRHETDRYTPKGATKPIEVTKGRANDWWPWHRKPATGGAAASTGGGTKAPLEVEDVVLDENDLDPDAGAGVVADHGDGMDEFVPEGGDDSGVGEPEPEDAATSSQDEAYRAAVEGAQEEEFVMEEDPAVGLVAEAAAESADPPKRTRRSAF